VQLMGGLLAILRLSLKHCSLGIKDARVMASSINYFAHPGGVSLVYVLGYEMS
jgi:hypothetical protein